MVSIQGLFDKFSPKKSGGKTRQQTLPAAFSRMKDRSSSKESSTPPSLTTASTATDRSSELGDDTIASSFLSSTKTAAKPPHKGRASPFDLSESNARPTNTEQIEVPNTSQSTQSRKARSSPSTATPSKSFSPKAQAMSSSPSTPTPQKDLVREGLDIHETDWELGALPGDGIAGLQEERPTPEQTPTHVKISRKATHTLSKTRGVLGKRRRTASDSASPGGRAAKSPKRENLRERSANGAVTKKREVSDKPTQKMTVKSTSTRRREKSSKVWLEHGIYVGQKRGSDPRLTQNKTSAKRKKGLLDIGPGPERRVLPLPMFHGEKLVTYGRSFTLPFDVFQPLPPGQPRPDEWKKTQKNVFVKEAKGGWPKSQTLDQSRCLCEPEEGCGENCLNRDMWYECNDSNCNSLPELCTNRPFAELKARLKKKKTNLASGKLIASAKYNTGVEVFKTADRGHGLRSCRTFRPNQVIVEYTGEIITRDEANRRVRNEYKDNACYYLMDFHHSTILDGSRGSIARFVNHSCAPNCRIEKWTVDGVPRMALFAGDKGIMTGDELTYDYNYAPYDQKNVTECKCGAAQCRGILGPKPKDKDLKDALKPIAGGKRKFEDLIDGAINGAKGLAANLNGKRRKINLPKGAKAILGNGKLDQSPSKPQRPLMKNGKPLPKGWVYPQDPFDFNKTINDDDPEAILRKRKRQALSRGGAGSPKKRKALATIRKEEVEGNQRGTKENPIKKMKTSKVDSGASAGVKKRVGGGLTKKPASKTSPSKFLSSKARVSASPQKKKKTLFNKATGRKSIGAVTKKKV